MARNFTLKDITSRQLIGRGSYGSVYAGDYIGSKVVVKVLEDDIDGEDVQKEASVMKLLNNCNVVGYLAKYFL